MAERAEFHDTFIPIVDLTGGDAVVKLAIVIGADDEKVPQRILEARPSPFDVLPVEHGPVPPVIAGTICVESGSKVGTRGSLAEPTKMTGHSTLFIEADPTKGQFPSEMGVANDLFKPFQRRLCVGLIDEKNDPWHVAFQLKDGNFMHRPQTDVEVYALGQRGGPSGGDPVYTPLTPGGQSKLAQTQIGQGNGPSGVFTPDPGGGGGGSSGGAGGGPPPARK